MEGLCKAFFSRGVASTYIPSFGKPILLATSSFTESLVLGQGGPMNGRAVIQTSKNFEDSPILDSLREGDPSGLDSARILNAPCRIPKGSPRFPKVLFRYPTRLDPPLKLPLHLTAWTSRTRCATAWSYHSSTCRASTRP